MENNTCFFFVDDIDSSFVQSELQNLLAYYPKVIVYTKSVVLREEPNVKFVHIDYANMNSGANFLSNLYLILQIYLNDIDFLKLSFSLAFIKYKTSAINRAVYLANTIILHQNLHKEAVYYSFWMNEWAAVLAILTKTNKISGFVSRVHGADLYEERVPKFKKLVLRKFQLKYVSKVFSISEKGTRYLKTKYPKYANKVETSYLGTNDYGLGKFNDEEVFTIVSCAKIRNIKRIHLISEILFHIDFPIKWIHIGDENIHASDPTIQLYFDNLKLLEQKNNIEIIRLGALSNSEILNYYKNNSINLFISVSETEGLPISMMEAISFGIPILSTNVGGCNEIVSEVTGVLIEKDFNSKEVAMKIAAIKSSELNTAVQRNKIRNYWKQKFSNNANFDSFINKL